MTDDQVIQGVHVPECNAGRDGDSHYLLPDGPQGSAFSHQRLT